MNPKSFFGELKRRNVYKVAVVQAHFGDLDSAIAALPHLLEVPAGLNIATLKLDPLWDPLRKDPRFAKLITEPQSKGSQK